MHHNDIDNFMVLPAFEDEPIEDDDDAYERRRQEAIDAAIEAGDHLLDQRKEQALIQECVWCGGEIFQSYPNKRDETFCSINHRTASNAALKRLIDNEDIPYWCHDCKRYLSESEGEVMRCSLDAYADLSVDYDLICAHCGNSDVTEVTDTLVNTLKDIAGTNQAD